MKVLHVITGLDQGGAEAVLYRLVTASAGEAEHIVVSMKDEGVYGPRLRQLGVTVHALGFPQGGITLKGLHRLWRLIATYKPDAVQTWMYHADLVGGVMARLGGTRAICWGIRNSNLSPETSSRSARWAARLCAGLSGFVPSAIVSCSEEAARVHQRLGYRASKFIVIPNGYDVSRFCPQPSAAAALRNEWGIAPEVPVLGTVARWDPQKDHRTLLDALVLLIRNDRDFYCVLAGPGMERSNADLARLISERSLDDKILLIGPRDDVPDIMNAIDVHVLSSAYGEAFPNAVCEAMACGTPCVVTDVGDAAAITGETGWVVPLRDPQALSQRIEEAITAIQSGRREEVSQACRQRIVEFFGIERMVAAYEDIWSQCRKPRVNAPSRP
ncbi:MAG: glycosyltransferase [Rhodomicrobium sp.]